MMNDDGNAAPALSVTAIDDHPAILAGVCAWLASARPRIITVVAAGPTIRTAWLPPGDTADVVILDLKLDQDPSPAYGHLRRLVQSGRKVVVYTMFDSRDIALACLDIGAATFLTKAEGDAHLTAAVLAAADDLPYLPPLLAGAIAANDRPGRPHLSSREQDVLTMWFQCESKQLVAGRIGISPKTVDTYLDRIRLKYALAGRSASTKAALLARAIQDGLVSLDDL